jgi:hypothetical protein
MARNLPPVDDDVFTALQALTEPLVDDINSVLRRLLGLSAEVPGAGHPERPLATDISDGRSRTSSSRRRAPAQARLARGATLPDTSYELPILEALVDKGGRAPSSEVVDRVGEILHGDFGDLDRGRLSSGDLRWRNRTQFGRLRLVQSGDMASDSPRGTWEITPQGRARASAKGT